MAKAPVLCALCQRAGHGPLTCPDRKSGRDREPRKPVARLQSEINQVTPPVSVGQLERLEDVAGTYAPGGQCPWCDKGREKLLARMRKYRQK